MVLLFPGCLYISDEMQAARLGQVRDAVAGDADADSDTDADADSGGDHGVKPLVEGMSPSYGTVSGGQVVTISGTDMDTVTRVLFGAVEAEVLVATSAGLRVTTPPAVDDGAVDVRVSGGRATVSAGSFEYIADGTGLVGLVGWVGVVDIVGNYWTEPPDDYGWAWFLPVLPTEFTAADLLTAPTLDTCADSDDVGADLTVYAYDWGGTASLDANGVATALPWDSAELGWVSEDVDANNWSPLWDYDLRGEGVAVVDSFAIAPLGQVPPSISVTAPSITGSTVAQVASSFNLAWTGEAGDFVIVELGVVSSTGSGYDQAVACRLVDDGAFTVPSSTWSSWPTGRQLNIFVYRVVVGEGAVPWNGSTASVMAVNGVYGAVVTR